MLLHVPGLVHAVGDAGPRAGEPDLLHGLVEPLAVLGLVDGVSCRADHLDAVLLEDAVLLKGERAVERGLSAHGRKDGVRALLGDDLLYYLPLDRLDVGRIGHVRIGHDRRRVGVNQCYPVAFLTEGLARLCT